MEHPHEHHLFREIEAPENGGAQPDAVPVGARLPHLLDVDVQGAAGLHARLSVLAVVVIGVGSIGMRVAFELARLGIRVLRLVDPGHLKAESALTYPVTHEDVGRAKVEHAGEICKRISPHTQVLVHEGRVEDLDTVAFLDTDLVVLAPDLLAPEVITGRHARLLGIPLIRASVHGDTLVAQLRSYAGEREGACPACFFDEQEWQDVYRQTRYSCDGAPVHADDTASVSQVTRSVGALCALAADLAVLEVLRRVVPVGRARGDVLVEYRGYTHEICETPLPLNLSCPGEHRSLTRVSVHVPFAASPLVELMAQAGIEADEVGALTITVDPLRYVERTRCACPSAPPYGRFAAPGESLGMCETCGRDRAADPLTTHHEVPGEVLAPVLHRTLAALGAPAAQSLTVRGEACRALLHAVR